MITEKHLCKECNYFQAHPLDAQYKNWVFLCFKKHENVNPDILVECDDFKEKKV